jgi:hypothetical protein
MRLNHKYINSAICPFHLLMEIIQHLIAPETPPLTLCPSPRPLWNACCRQSSPLTAAYEVQSAYDTNTICTLVTNEWQRLIAQCINDLRLHVRECLPLLKPRPDGDTFNVPSNAPINDADVVAAAPASEEGRLVIF